jgi:hypothetical protein
MDMRVPVQGLSPGVQNAKNADFGAETLGVGSYFHKRGTGSLEQERKQELLVLPHQRDQAVGDAEDDMEVSDGQQFLAPFLEPLLACVDLALGAVAIAA